MTINPHDPDRPTDEHLDRLYRMIYPGPAEATAELIRSLARLAWTWTRSKLRRRPEPRWHEAWCPDDGSDCECWRFLLESDPSAERFMTELDDDQRRDR